MKKFVAILSAVMMLMTVSVTAQNTQNKKAKELKTIEIKAKVDCNGCKTKIEKNIAFQKGVKSVTADVKTKIVTISYRTDKNTDTALLKVIQDLGYGGEIVQPNKGKQKATGCAGSTGCGAKKTSGCCSGR